MEKSFHEFLILSSQFLVKRRDISTSLNMTHLVLLKSTFTTYRNSQNFMNIERLAGSKKTHIGLLLIAGSLAIGKTSNAADKSLSKAFTNVTEQVGLTGLSRRPANWIDFDHDGYVDLYSSGQLWHNVKGKRFERVKDAPLKGWGTWADYDNDGYIDMCSSANGGSLFHNDEGNGFTRVKNAIPKLPTTVSLGAAWFDMDNDGLLDLYVGGYEVWGKENYPDVMLRNQGDGTFKQVWQSPGKPQPARGITAADYDEDGDMDVYVSNYRLVQNYLWNNNGKGEFTDVGIKAGVAGIRKLKIYFGHTIGSAWGDFDNDGHLDLFVGNFSHPPSYQDRPKFLKNLGAAGDWHFEDVSADAGLHWQESFASPTLADFDNDGLLDLFFTTVYSGDSSVLYRNKGDWKFKNVTSDADIKSQKTYQGAWGDFNNNGYPDLVTDGKLYLNPGGHNNWLKVKVEGSKKANRSAIGAQVRIKLEDKTLTRQVESSTGQGNQNEMTLLFGLGDYDKKLDVQVRWPDGKTKDYRVSNNRLLRAKR